MPSSSESFRAALQSAEAALLEKIEQLSFIRTLNDRLAQASDFASACGALVTLVSEECRAEAVAYLSVDPERNTCRLEAVAPSEVPPTELNTTEPPLPALLGDAPTSVLRTIDAPRWLGIIDRGGTMVGAPMRVRGAITGLLLVYHHGDDQQVQEDERLLAIVTTSAALALDVSRSEAREEYLAMLRHDINNPVTAAIGFLELMVDKLEEDGDDRLRQLAAGVLESLQAVADLVSNHLHMAAIDRGVPWLHCGDVDVRALTGDIVERLRHPAAEKEITVTCEGGAHPIRADRRQLGRVITNLIGNAIKYTPGPGTVQVTVADERGGVQLSVADSGYGVAAEDIPRLFQKYARFHRDRGIPGTGLGLYLSKAIVEAHGGTIEVESEVGRGSTFTVRLPRLPPRAATAPAA
jgi:signal transduction histidine kinase